jgi:Cu2+-exporting ATPase
VDRVIAGVLPDGKEAVIRELKKRGKTAMTGDGINDAPALTRADIGIAIGAGTDVAIDSADIVLMNSRLKDVAAAVRLSRATLRNIHENLFWAFFYNVICIPLAAGLYAWKMNPMVGAAAMSLSSFTVCMNALRLNLFNLHDSSKDRPLRKKALPYTEEKPEEPVTKAEPEAQKVTLHITGMMCPHCEATVEKALKQIDGVTDAKASHEQGTAEVILNRAVDRNVLNTAVIDAGYEITDTQEKEEEIRMEKVLHVEGMMCEHCEATVKKALEAVDGVESAAADHNANIAKVTLSKDVADEVLKEAVEAKDYKVTGFGA